MIEFTDAHFDDLCRSGEVRMQIATLEESRKAAVRHFWFYLLFGLLLSIAIAATLLYSGWFLVAIILAIAVFTIALILALRPLHLLSEDLKLPVLEALARQGGMEFLPSGFDPPVYPDARRVLFGGGLSGQSFSDLFHGTDADGKKFAVYEATLTRSQGKNTQTVFSGQVYAFQRRSKGGGETAIVPDRGILNFFKPGKGMERVKFEGDSEFEKRFEVYSTHPASALGLLGTDTRRALLGLREQGRVMAYVGPDDILVAMPGKNRFEPGSMFRSVAGQARVRQMFDDVCASLGVLRLLKSRLD